MAKNKSIYKFICLLISVFFITLILLIGSVGAYIGRPKPIQVRYVFAKCESCHYDILIEDFKLKSSHHPVPEKKISCAGNNGCHRLPTIFDHKKELSIPPYKLLKKEGNDLCFICHGRDSTLTTPYGDHETKISHPTIGLPDPPSGTKIKCLNCHFAHGSEDRALLVLDGDGLCLNCHKNLP